MESLTVKIKKDRDTVPFKKGLRLIEFCNQFSVRIWRALLPTHNWGRARDELDVNAYIITDTCNVSEIISLPWSQGVIWLYVPVYFFRCFWSLSRHLRSIFYFGYPTLITKY